MVRRFKVLRKTVYFEALVIDSFRMRKGSGWRGKRAVYIFLGVLGPSVLTSSSVYRVRWLRSSTCARAGFAFGNTRSGRAGRLFTSPLLCTQAGYAAELRPG